MSEESLMMAQESERYDDEYLSAYSDVPYFLLEDFIPESKRGYIYSELTYIKKMYYIYRKGVEFIPEGSNGDYIPSYIRFKKASSIMNKEARFLFANPPSFNVNLEDVDGNKIEENAKLQEFLDSVLEKNKFNNNLLKSLKDCFIGKRIGIVLNFNEEKGITITFLNSLQFYFETDGSSDNSLTLFVSFYEINKVDSLKNQKWHKKVYSKEEDGIYVEEIIYDGLGEILEVVFPKTKIKFKEIPAVVVLNDGLLGDVDGESELSYIDEYEGVYSKISNGDIDAERKSMNPIRYTIDASEGSTRNLPTSPGSYWDIQSDDEKAIERAAKTGILEPQMNYSTPLKQTLDRIESEMYSAVDVPNIASDKLSGIITSGKTIGALYWGLTVRSDEKMLAWEPELKNIAIMIIEGGKLYPNCIKKYTEEKKLPDTKYKITVTNNYPLPEDIKDEKEVDMNEVEFKLMSKKTYIKKWRKLSDKKIEDELLQIKKEQQMFEESMLSYSTKDVAGVEDELNQNYNNLSRRDNPNEEPTIDDKNDDNKERKVKEENNNG